MSSRDSELVRELMGKRRFSASRSGIETCLELSREVGNPHENLKTVHIAGTNGKGSVATKMAKALQREGYTVGLYTSPHIHTFRERIRIGDELISEKEIARLLPPLLEIANKKQISATFFDFTTLLAFQYFSDHKIDIGIIETGLGGRLDATNILSPLLSIITSISFDHTKVLGNDLESIAKEKAGIIKRKTPVLIGPCVPRAIVEKYAFDLESPLKQVTARFSPFDRENQAISAEGLNLLHPHFPTSMTARRVGLAAVPPCRMEVTEKGKVPVIFDVAHNPDALHQLVKAVRMRFPQRKVRAFFGVAERKDVRACREAIVDRVDVLHEVVPSETDSADHEIVKELTHAYHSAEENDQVLLICGSCLLMRPAVEALTFTLKEIDSV